MKTAYVATDVRVFEDSAGIFWSTHSSVNANALSIYLEEFDRVCLVARVTRVDPGRANIVTAPQVNVLKLADNPAQQGLLRSAATAIRSLRKLTVGRDDLVVFRVPEFVSVVAWVSLLSRRTRRLSIVVAEPAGVSRMLLGRRSTGTTEKFFSWVARLVVATSHGSVYVTRQHLQKAVPPRKTRPTLARSNVRIDPTSIARSPREVATPAATLHILSAGGMNDQSKGFDILIDAVAVLMSRGQDVRCTLLGDGVERPRLRDQAQALGVDDRVTLPGFVADASEMRAAMLSADLFVLASRTEGLPRVLVEAMSCGLPTIGSDVGGIPEVVDHDVLFRPEPTPLAELVERLTSEPGLLSRLSASGLETARTLVDATSVHTFRDFLVTLRRRSSTSTTTTATGR